MSCVRKNKTDEADHLPTRKTPPATSALRLGRNVNPPVARDNKETPLNPEALRYRQRLEIVYGEQVDIGRLVPPS